MNAEKKPIDQLRIDRSAPRSTRAPGWIVALAVVILGMLALGVWIGMRPNRVAVRTVIAREMAGPGGSKTVLNASGYVVARREATVSSKITGKVLEVFVEEGKKVTEGQILARLDASNIQANFDLAEAQLLAARSGLNEIQIRLEDAEKERVRISGLAQEKIASTADLDHAQAEAQSQKARLDRQKVEVSVAERQVALWQQQRDDAIIRAPFAGVITSKNAQPGEMISPMSAGGGFTRTGICTIVDMDSLEIEIDVNESFINRVTPGQPVMATLDAYPDWPIPAKVIAIIPTADRQKATVKVRVGFEKLDPRIVPEMGIKVAFQGTDSTPAVQRGVMVPASAVHRQDGRDVVWVVRDSRAERRVVSVGATRQEEIIIVSGLNSGEKVIVQGPENMTAGQRIQEAGP